MEELVKHESAVLAYAERVSRGSHVEDVFIFPITVRTTTAKHTILIFPHYGEALTLEHLQIEEFASKVLEWVLLVGSVGIGQGDLKPDAFRYYRG
jgi:hypothetical protein